VSTIFLAFGNMFPHLRSDFWFPATFILSRIIYHTLILQEIMFNYTMPSGAAELFAISLLVHVYWINKYFVGVRRRACRRKATALKQLERKGDAKEAESEGRSNGSSTATSTLTTGSIGKTIQLRIQKSRK
jgi:hypothetical protein